ncbi:MAG: tRNA lysidine(34) synthetase TilS, partial [Alloprevotella sp.]|nr:tRNA lysidine(34) synthetase TilS [Alloprevotella sp.]
FLLLVLKVLGFRPVAAHCNFGLRWEESERDDAYVRDLCGRDGIPLVVERFDTRGEAGRRRVSIEMAARDLRYAWFAELLEREQLPFVAVGLHRDDNAETFFLNLVRGSGLRGLAGMRPRHGRVVRPLLEVARAEIEEWLSQRGCGYVTDSTNADTTFRRNKVRHDVLPLLRELNPSFNDTLAATMRRLAVAGHYERLAVAELYGRHLRVLPDGVQLCHLHSLTASPAAEAAIHSLLAAYGFAPAVARDVFAHLDDGAGRLYENATHIVESRSMELDVRRKPVHFGPEPLREGHNTLPDGTRLLLTRTEQVQVVKAREVACLDADAVRGPLTCRSVVGGDRFRPFGMQGTKLVNDFLYDLGYSRVDRLAAKVLCDGSEIVWVVGERPADGYAVRPGTRRMLRVELLSGHPFGISDIF